jgi:hypothetical protein
VRWRVELRWLRMELKVELRHQESNGATLSINVNWDHLANELENVLVRNWHQNMFWG